MVKNLTDDHERGTIKGAGSAAIINNKEKENQNRMRSFIVTLLALSASALSLRDYDMTDFLASLDP